MASSETESREDKWMGARVDPNFKRLVKMRAAELDMTLSGYIEHLAREDLETVEYADL